MSDTHASHEAGSVLRPFEEHAREPLPPVEPSKVVPEDRAPEVPDVIRPQDVIEAPSEAPVEAEVADPAAPPTDDAAADDPPPDIEEIWAVGEHDPADTPTDEPEVPEATTSTVADTVTLPRLPFLIGLGVVGVVLVALLALWQTAGGGSAETALADRPAGSPLASSPTPVDNGDGPVDLGVDPASLAAAEQEAVALQAEVDGLTAQVDVLETELAAVPPPPLPGTAIHRIPVASGSKFVSATDTSVAVVSPFGGYANINPATDTVTASGIVSDGGATRVMRTPSSVWVTDYSDGKLVRIDPQANTVALSYDFPGPDGLAKFGDTLLVASFDGQFLGQIDPTTGERLLDIALGGSPTAVLVHDTGVWVALFDTGEVVRVDPGSLQVTDRILVGAGPVDLAASDGGIWVTNHNEGTVALVDPTTATVSTTIEVGEGPTGLVAVGSSLWVTVTDAGDLVEIDIPNRAIVGRTSLGGPNIGGGPVGISAGAGSLWVAMDGEDSVVRVALPE